MISYASGMYTDDQSLQAFSRMHARERLIEQARHVGDPTDEPSLFWSHAAAERSAGVLIIALGIGIIIACAALLLGLL